MTLAFCYIFYVIFTNRVSLFANFWFQETVPLARACEFRENSMLAMAVLASPANLVDPRDLMNPRSSSLISAVTMFMIVAHDI